jgi:hypothetical protein
VNNLKDYCVDYNKQISLFNQIYNQEFLNRQTGADDGMVNLRTGKLEPTMTWFLRSQISDTRIELVLNSSAFTGGKLLGTNLSGGQGQMSHLQ